MTTNIALESYNGRKLTFEEIQLMEYYRKQREDKLNLQKRKNDENQLLSLKAAPTIVVDERKSLKAPIIQDAFSNNVNDINNRNKWDKNNRDDDANNYISNKEKEDNYNHDSSSDSDSDSENEASMSKNKNKKRKKIHRLGANELDLNKFPVKYLLHSSDMNPKTLLNSNGTTTGESCFILNDFGYSNMDGGSSSSKQTLAFKITVPKGSESWAINILQISNNDLPSSPSSSPSSSSVSTALSNIGIVGKGKAPNDILFHFNPRNTTKRQELIMNDRVSGGWGALDSRSLDKLPPLFDTNMELVIQFRPEGYCVYINGLFACIFPKRTDINVSNDNTKPNKLVVQIPLTDDRCWSHDVEIHKIWWGYQSPEVGLEDEIIQDLDQANTTTTTTEANIHTIFIGNLPKVKTPADIDVLTDQLMDLFDEYGAASEDNIRVMGPKGVAFVTLSSAEKVQEAIEDCNGATLEDEHGEEYSLLISRAWNR